jgi:mRNA degradation ribonuclease J1/J2
MRPITTISVAAILSGTLLHLLGFDLFETVTFRESIPATAIALSIAAGVFWLDYKIDQRRSRREVSRFNKIKTKRGTK